MEQQTPSVPHFKGLGQSECNKMVRNEYFVGIIPVFQLFKKKKKNYKSHFM